MKREEVVKEIAIRFGWSQRFASEYLVELRNGFSKYKAFEMAKRSFWLSPMDVPKFNPFDKE